jgi:hypothetical protein
MGHPFLVVSNVPRLPERIICPSKVAEMIEAILKLDVDWGRCVAA